MTKVEHPRFEIVPWFNETVREGRFSVREYYGDGGPVGYQETVVPKHEFLTRQGARNWIDNFLKEESQRLAVLKAFHDKEKREFYP